MPAAAVQGWVVAVAGGPDQGCQRVSYACAGGGQAVWGRGMIVGGGGL